jgi:heme-degrading monooxygenase HmoA
MGNGTEAMVSESVCLISVTRLRLASWRFVPGFAWFALRSTMQARRAAGFRGLQVLADRRLTFWTATAWDDAAAMKSYRGSGAHRAAMRHLARWCDEASVARFSAPPATLGDWAALHARMLAEGEISHVQRPSPAQTARAWAAPRTRPPVVLAIGPAARAR